MSSSSSQDEVKDSTGLRFSPSESSSSSNSNPSNSATSSSSTSSSCIQAMSSTRDQASSLRSAAPSYYHRLLSPRTALLMATGVLLAALWMQYLVGLDRTDITDLVRSLASHSMLLLLLAALLVWVVAVRLGSQRSINIYLLDFETYKPIEEQMVGLTEFVDFLDRSGTYTPDSINFLKKVSATSGLGPRTAVPQGLIADPMRMGMEEARREAQLVMFQMVEALLHRHRLTGRDINILVVNCSLFCPTPSLAAMIANRFHMKSNVASFNLGGMGCSASLIALDLARAQLQLPEHRGRARALVVSYENITQAAYRGNERAMLLQNALFRLGGAAYLLTNREDERKKAKLKLRHSARTMKTDDESYQCVYLTEDAEGWRGVRLSKHVMRIAAETLKTNITAIAPIFLPWSEQIKFVLNLWARLLLSRKLSSSIPLLLARALYASADVLLRRPAVGETNILAMINRSLRGVCSLPLDSVSSSASTSPSGAAESLSNKQRRRVEEEEEEKSTPPPSSSVSAETKEESTESKLKRELGAPYVPNFEKAFTHFCIHAGGRAVLDAIQSNLRLSDDKMAASRHVLWTRGNTSSSSLWYELEYHLQPPTPTTDRQPPTPDQSHAHLSRPSPTTLATPSRGDLLWMIAFGSGFKCNSAVWEVL